MRLFSTTYERLRQQSFDCAAKYLPPNRLEWLKTQPMKMIYEALLLIEALHYSEELGKEAKALAEAWREFVELVGLVQDEAQTLRDSIPFARRPLVAAGRVL